MVGVTRLKVQETAAALEALLPKQSNPMLKERLQMLYWLQLPEAMSVSAVAKVIGRHRSRVQRWLSVCGDGGRDRLLAVRQSPGRPRVMPEWAVTRLQKRWLACPGAPAQAWGNGCSSRDVRLQSSIGSFSAISKSSDLPAQSLRASRSSDRWQ